MKSGSVNRFSLLLVILSLSGYLMAPLCGSNGGSQNSQCSEAADLYNLAQSFYQEMNEKHHFGTTWTVTVQENFEKESEEYTQAIGESTSGEVFYETDYYGAVYAGSEMIYTFDVPEVLEPLTCEDVIMAQMALEEGGGDPKEMLWGMMIMNSDMFFEVFDGFEIIADGTSWTSEEQSWGTHDYVYGSMCFHDNPCPRKRDETSGCPRTVAAVTANATVYIGEGGLEDDVLIWIEIDEENFSRDTPTQTYKSTYEPDDIYWDIHINNDTDACTWATPYCLGESSREDPCGVSDWCVAAVDIHDEIVFEAGAQHVQVDDRTDQIITLTCTSGCECTSASECDDANICTHDSCEGGNCVNTADDSIERPQHSLHDCKEQVCKDGKPVDINADYEVPEEDDEGDCKIEVCRDGEIAQDNDNDDIEEFDPHDCQLDKCENGNPIEEYDNSQWPLDEDPYDCQTWICNDAIKAWDIVDDNTQFPPDNEPGNCHHTICDMGEPTGLYTNDDPPENNDHDCVYLYCDDVYQMVISEDRNNEIPPQNAPDDCKKEICLDSFVESIDDPTEPDCG